MASERISDKLCRLCDKHNNKLYSIFEHSNDGHQIIQLIKECLPLIVSLQCLATYIRVV